MSIFLFWFLAGFLAVWWGAWLARIVHRHWWSIREARRYQRRAMRRALSRYVLSQVKSPPRLSHSATIDRCDDPPNGLGGGD